MLACMGVDLDRVGGCDDGKYEDAEEGNGRTEDRGPHDDGRSIDTLVITIRVMMEEWNEPAGDFHGL